MPVWWSETSWQHIYETIMFHLWFLEHRVLLLQKGSSRGNCSPVTPMVSGTVLCKVGFEKVFAGWNAGLPFPAGLFAHPGQYPGLLPVPTSPDMPEEDRSSLAPFHEPKEASSLPALLPFSDTLRERDVGMARAG